MNNLLAYNVTRGTVQLYKSDDNDRETVEKIKFSRQVSKSLDTCSEFVFGEPTIIKILRHENGAVELQVLCNVSYDYHIDKLHI